MRVPTYYYGVGLICMSFCIFKITFETETVVFLQPYVNKIILLSLVNLVRAICLIIASLLNASGVGLILAYLYLNFISNNPNHQTNQNNQNNQNFPHTHWPAYYRGNPEFAQIQNIDVPH